MDISAILMLYDKKLGKNQKKLNHSDKTYTSSEKKIVKYLDTLKMELSLMQQNDT
jgi:hypothetical protein